MSVMSKLTFASAAIIISLAGCGSERAESTPAASPADVEVNDDSGAAAEEVSETEATTEEAEPAEAESAEPEKAESSSLAEPEPQPTCAELPEKTCQVTKGCAWSTDKKCVEQ